MMLTEKECREALKGLRNLERYENLKKWNQVAPQVKADVIERLIKEHFKDKKSLEERFKDYEGEIPKDNPWGDRYADECSKEEINKWLWEGYGIPPIREKDDVD